MPLQSTEAPFVSPCVAALCLAVGLTTVGCQRQTAPPTAAPTAASPRAPAPSPGELPSPEPSIVDLESAFERAAAAIGPSVVSIINERDGSGAGPLWKRPLQPPGQGRGLGSGVIIDARGYILTNNHVVEGARVLKVRLHDDRELNAELVGTDPKTDLAVIAVQAEGLQAARLHEGADLRVGQWVLAVGSPFGLRSTVTAGIVSAVGRGSMGITDYGDFIQTDASINRGNSGGPLIDLRGRVVGINTAIFSPNGGGSSGIGFAIPSEMARAVKDQLIERGHVRRGWLGIVMGELTPDLAESFDYDGEHGVLLDDVDPSGPAHAAGLREGDIIAQLDGKPVREMADFRNAIASAGPDETVALQVWREGQSRSVSVELGLLPGSGRNAVNRSGPRKPGSSKPKPAAEPAALGLTLGDLGKGGVRVDRVASGSLAEDSGLRRGDILISIGGSAVETAKSAHARLEHADLDAGVRLRVQRGPYGRFVVLRRHPPAPAP